ncbi:hypothetical protein BDQ12DRAFT_607120 [Crucibulum laeve]|uniref:HAT C-terminal dimerisation domain-containing protein n=1 Tax=Crucibulum laeve TaxID=68775 RepID=A0A5C3LYQ2_9AGAR|nr:hypothetical protein BDQ12DRAFT_607120 [Crucibulum laeve]
MGSDFCSAPASSVDAEHAFSTGRLDINHLQHQMNSQTFKAQIAVGSWAKTPLYPGFDAVKTLIQGFMDGEKDCFVLFLS